MIPLDKVAAWLALAVGMLGVIFGALALRDVHTLTSTNATLVDLVYTKIDSIADARVAAIHREFDEALRAALTGGGAVAADRFLQRSADK